uniref:Uncharacterized protein n=1 Tax=Candidatus Shikimatogenerans sp. Tder TaxID=3158566 RepID=A0AAU7QR68_9FLAO
MKIAPENLSDLGLIPDIVYKDKYFLKNNLYNLIIFLISFNDDFLFLCPL